MCSVPCCALYKSTLLAWKLELWNEENIVRVAVITGSTRPGRKNAPVARWVYELAHRRTDAEIELVDINEYHLPLLDEPLQPSLGQYSQPHTKAWAAKIATFDAYVFVTAEYNHGTSAALKNAIDYLFREWTNKAAGFVSYGSVGGARAVEHLRVTLAEVMIATVRAQVMLSLFADFDNLTEFAPDPRHEREVHTMLDQVIAWGGALRSLRIPLSEQDASVERRRPEHERVS
jgi:NAD(P)H-dependent FMN reductase